MSLLLVKRLTKIANTKNIITTPLKLSSLSTDIKSKEQKENSHTNITAQAGKLSINMINIMRLKKFIMNN